MYDILVVGGGAAGFFAAISAGEACSGQLKIAIVEQGQRVLQKVRISGGGRCNVTHAEFDPRALVKHYPRGHRELLGPFTKFAPGDTMHWFAQQGVELKIEDDGRVFPVSDSSETIINALTKAAKHLGVAILTKHKITGLHRNEGGYQLQLATGNSLSAKQVILATGSSPKVYTWLDRLDIKLVDPVPSLFTFNVPNKRLHELSGLSVQEAIISFDELSTKTKGPLLITHWGFSGPAILRASAEAAIGLHQLDYRTGFSVSWTGQSTEDMLAYLQLAKVKAGKQTLKFDAGLGIPKRLWAYLLERAKLQATYQWASLKKEQLKALAICLASDRYVMEGQTRFKEEFVTAGGIELREIDFKRFAVKKMPGLFAAGELLNIDGVTGGFNFQAAWTGGYLAGNSAAKEATST